MSPQVAQRLTTSCTSRPHLRWIFFVHVAVRIEIASMHFSRQMISPKVNDSLKTKFECLFSKQRQTCRRLVVKHQRGIQHIQFLGKEGDKWIVDMEHNQTEVMEPTILHKLFVVRCTGYNFWNITENSSKSFSANNRTPRVNNNGGCVRETK